MLITDTHIDNTSCEIFLPLMTFKQLTTFECFKINY